MLSLEHNAKATIDAIERLKKILTHPRLTAAQRDNALINLAQAYQRRGDHHAALDALASIEKQIRAREDRILAAYAKNLRAVSYCALRSYKESCDLFDEALKELDKLDPDPKLRAGVSLEAGKAFRARGDNDRARECWEQALKCFESRDDEREHYARTKANLGNLFLDHPDEAKQEEGVKIIEESSSLKRLIGDLEGLANNYCNLGLYYWRKKRYERAIAFTRMDLYLSRKVGDLRAIAATLGNLAAIYSDLKQFSPARTLLKEAKEIGETLNDQRLIAITNHNLDAIEQAGKEAGQMGERIGPTADCGCGSGKEYQECCGRADFEPIDIPMQFGGISEDLAEISKGITDAGGEPSRLDFILRQTEQSKERFAWSRIKVHDGWLEMDELPDMANHHFISAKILADEAKSEPDSVTKPLACIILCVCALEAFINQVAFFLYEMQTFPESKLHVIPPELAGDLAEFQRRTELTLKWEILGNALCGSHWPPRAALWTEFRNLVYIRNELVHFKAADYERVVPPPAGPHDILRRVPEGVETRKIPHGWPTRLLTPSFATWCVNVAESMIGHFRWGYSQRRLTASNSKTDG